jgi:hypothetical protein
VKPSVPLTRKTPLRAHSKKWNRNRKARRAVVAEVFERDHDTCQFSRFVAEACEKPFNETRLSLHDLLKLTQSMTCFGEKTPHEPAHSRNVGRFNTDETYTACVFHNEFAENEPELCRKIGWSVQANGYPLSHVEIVENLRGLRCPKCYLAFEVDADETPESLAAECGIGHHTDTDEGCPEVAS